MKRREFLLAGSAAMLWPTVTWAQQEMETFDVLVIGAGGAGLSAAIIAKDAGANVLVLEKMSMIGGNTQLAAGGMNAAETPLQKQRGVEDSWRRMYDDTMKGGRNRNQADLVELMCKGSAGAVAWLTELGARIEVLKSGGGASVDRSHSPPGGAAFGPYIMRVLHANVQKRQVPIRKNSKVVALLQRPDGGVRGVVVQDRRGALYNIGARAVVIASGGFGSSPELIARYKPEYAGFSSTGQPGSTGDALTFAEQVGAEVFDLDQVQIHPTQAKGAKTLISESGVRGSGAILVNRDGKRFVNELTTRDRSSAAVLEQTGRSAFLVFDDQLRASREMVEGYIHLELVKQGQTVEALAKASGIDSANLVRTVESYNRYQAEKNDAEFGRRSMPLSLTKPPFYAIEINPGIHFTMGGIRINARTQVMSRDRKPIPGLYACGEVTGGVHGANRLGGTAMTALFTFGPLAGREATAFVKG